jgi:hypothetical protein
VIRIEWASKNVHILIASHEKYHGSYVIGLDDGAFATEKMLYFDNGNYGALTSFFGIDAANNKSELTTETWTLVAFVGHKNGKGIAITADYTTGTTKPVFPPATTLFTNNAISGIVRFDAPAGGVAQFKGLLQDATADKYVEVICHGIQPVFAVTPWQGLDTDAASGWIVTCMTGIPQCVWAVTDAQLTAAETASCQADPRYLTWRMMTTRIQYDGTLVWYRTDSYWDVYSSEVSSCWGPSIKLSTNEESNVDNNGATAATDLGKGYVFAFSDGSGVQLNHLSWSVFEPTGESAAGGGLNTIVSAPAAGYANTYPDQYAGNFCSDTNLHLAASTQWSSLAAVVQNYSDGYFAKLTITMDWVLSGALGGWRGTCMVNYTSGEVQDTRTGALCIVY